MTLLDYLMKRNRMGYRHAIDAIRFGRVQVSGRVSKNPLTVVPYSTIVLVTKPAESHAPQDVA